MKILKWFLITILVLLILGVGFVFALPYILGDELRAEVKEQIGNYVDAEVDFGEVNFSIFRSFPKLSIVVNDVTVNNSAKFDSMQLAAIDELSVGVDFWSAISDGPIIVHEVELVRPDLHMYVNDAGESNIDIMREIEQAEETTAESGSFSMNLERYAIVNGRLVYDDLSGGTIAISAGLNHEGSGNFDATTYTLKTETAIDSVLARSGGIYYLNNAEVSYDADFLIDTEAGSATLADNKLVVNELALEAEGVLGFPDDAGNMKTDLTFRAPEQSFRALWSAIPADFTRDLKDLKTSGAFSVSGKIEGMYGIESGSLPAFAVDLDVDNASVQYPDLPKSINALNVTAGIRSAGRDLSDLLIQVPAFSFRLGENPFRGKLDLRNGMTNPVFDVTAIGKLDLGDISAALPLEGVNELSGLVDLNVKAAGDLAGAQQDLRSVNSSGIARLSQVVYDAEGLPRVEIKGGSASLKGSDVQLSDMAIQAGSSDLVLNGTLNDPYALATETGVLRGDLNVRAGTLNANDWLTEEEVSVEEPATASERPFDRFDMAMDLTADKVIYDVYELQHASVQGNLSPERLKLAQTAFSLEGSSMKMNGELNNLYGYAFDNEELIGLLNFDADKLDLLAISEVGVDPNTPATTPEEDAAYIELPERMTVRVNSNVGELLYDDVALKDVSGIIALANQQAIIQNGKASVAGGELDIDGNYSYLGPDIEPTFNLTYAMKNAGFREVFEQFNSIQKLAPIAEYLSGNFNANMSLSSTLGRDMMPNLEKLDAEGLFNTINATIKDFAPLSAAANKLGLKSIGEVKIKNTKNYFSIVDGLVTVKPFDVNFKGIDATIQGTHGLNQAMNYDIIALVPRKLLNFNSAGQSVNKGLELLGQQASKLGLNLAVGEFIRVKFNVTGSIDKPSVKMQLLGSEGEGSVTESVGTTVKDLAKQAQDSIERVAQAKIDAARDEAKRRAQQAQDSIQRAAKAKLEATRKEAERKAAEAKAKAEAEAKRKIEAAKKKAAEEAKKKASGVLKDIFKKNN